MAGSGDSREAGGGWGMSSEIVENSLNSLCLLVVDCPHATPKWTDSGVIVLRNQNIKGGRLDLSTPSFTDEENYRSRVKRATPKAGDLVITREAPMGDVCQIPQGLRCCLGQRQVLLRPDPAKIDARFLLFALQSPYIQHQIGWNEGTGSTVSNLRIPVLEALKIPTPSMSRQVEIASLLGAIDDRIALLRETNATLEAIAQALFKSWFVDFDPVYAKQQGIAPAGMDDATAALFPDGFEESALGLVPKGWCVKPIGNVCFLGRGSSPRPIQAYMGDDIPWIKIADATASDGMFVFNTKEKIKAEGALKSVAVSHGDLIMSNSASCGIPVFVGLKGCIHDGWLYFRDFRFVSKNLMFYWLRYISSHLVNIADGSVQKNLNTGLVSSQLIICPAAPVLSAFELVIQPLLDRIKANCQQAQTLATLRDTLLPRLISGQLRLPQETADQVEALHAL